MALDIFGSQLVLQQHYLEAELAQLEIQPWLDSLCEATAAQKLDLELGHVQPFWDLRINFLRSF